MAQALIDAAKSFHPQLCNDNATIDELYSKLSLLHGHWSADRMKDFDQEVSNFPESVPKPVIRIVADTLRRFLREHNLQKRDRSEFVKTRDERADQYLDRVASTGDIAFPRNPICFDDERSDHLPDEDLGRTWITAQGRIGPPQHVKHIQANDIKPGEIVTPWELTFRDPDIVIATCLSRRHETVVFQYGCSGTDLILSDHVDVPSAKDTERLILDAYPMGKLCHRDVGHWHSNMVREKSDGSIDTRWTWHWDQTAEPREFSPA